MPQLTINGQSYFSDSPPDTPLLWVIREDLRLTGTKYGCGLGLCGACTVHINGQAQRSCQINLADLPAVLVFAQVLHAATFGCFHAAAIAFVQASFGARQQGQGQALYAALSGTGGALGALYSGYSWKLLGPSFTFGMASVAALAAAVIIAIRSNQTRNSP